MQPWVRLLTIRAVLWTSLCCPAVMTSHFSLDVPAQSTNETGTRFARKSPAVGSTNKHCPLGARISTLAKALVALSSRRFASAAAVGSKSPPRPTGTAAVGIAMTVEFPLSSVPDDDGEVEAEAEAEADADAKGATVDCLLSREDSQLAVAVSVAVASSVSAVTVVMTVAVIGAVLVAAVESPKAGVVFVSIAV